MNVIKTSIGLTLCLLLLNSNTALAAVYKFTDKDGNVVYSDVPSSKDDKKIKPPPIMTFKPIDMGATNNKKRKRGKSVAKYQSLVITAPSNGQTLRANDGRLSVQFQSSPPLKASSKHRFVVLLNGSIAQQGSSIPIAINNIPRGSHNINVEIRDSNDNVLISSSSVTVHIQRHSALFNRKAKPKTP